MNRHVEALTQAEQDRSENGVHPSHGDFYRHQGEGEPRCPKCKSPFIRKSIDVVECCGCREKSTGQMLAKFGIKIEEIG